MFRLAVFLVLLLAMPARANLGETVTQCVQRYGKPVTFSEAGPKNPFGTIVFIAGPYQLIIFLANDVEVGARVTKKDKSAFLPDEMKTIMNADANTPWVPVVSRDPTCLQWARSDQASAIYDQDRKILMFTSPQMAQAFRTGPAAPTPPPAPAPPKPAIPIAPPAPTPWTPAAAPTP